MERLMMETTKGTQPIDLDMVEKYDLHKGTHSPFTNRRIIGEGGDFPDIPFQDMEPIPSMDDLPKDGFPDDEIDTMNHGFEFSTSEMIDFAQGVDSD